MTRPGLTAGALGPSIVSLNTNKSSSSSSSSTGPYKKRTITAEAGVCVFYYCRTYYKAVRVGGGGEWRTCAMRDDEPRPVWMSLSLTH